MQIKNFSAMVFASWFRMGNASVHFEKYRIYPRIGRTPNFQWFSWEKKIGEVEQTKRSLKSTTADVYQVKFIFDNNFYMNMKMFKL